MHSTPHTRRSGLVTWSTHALVVLSAAAVAMGAAWLVLAVLIVPRLHADNRPPKAWVEATRFDVGPVQQGDQVTTRFAITNRGGRRLIVRAHSESCECAAANVVKPLVLSSGETAHVSPLLDTSQLAGPVQIEFRYRTNDTRSPLLILSVLADVQPKPGNDPADRATTSVLVRS